MNIPFDIDPSLLENNLFTTDTRRYRSGISPSHLPNLFYYIKSQLTETEKNSLKDYDVQVFLIEMAISSKKYVELTPLTDHILKEIKKDTKYWIKGTEPFMTILSSQEGYDEESAKNNDLAIFNKENEKAFKEFKEYYQEVDRILEPTLEEEAEEESQVQVGEIQYNPRISTYIQPNEEFDVEEFQEVIENFYSSKHEQKNTKRSTRLQAKRNQELCYKNPQKAKHYLNIYRSMRDEDPCFAQNFITINRSKKIPRLELQLLPTIQKFIFQKHDIPIEAKIKEQVFLSQRLQNLIFLCLMTDNNKYSYARVGKYPKGSFFEEEMAPEVNHTLEYRNDPLLEDFRKFAFQNGIDVVILFSDREDPKEKRLNLLSNTLKIVDKFIKNLGRWELSIKPTLDILEVTYDPEKITNLINGMDEREYEDYIHTAIIDFYHLQFERKSVFEYTVKLNQYSSLYLRKNSTEAEMTGIFSSLKFCTQAIENYDKYIKSPFVAKKRDYIFNGKDRKKILSEKECKKFLEGLYKFYDTPVNNKKIARFIGQNIKPNHIRFIKGKYIRSLRKRAKNSKVPIRDLLKVDIETNNINDVLAASNISN